MEHDDSFAPWLRLRRPAWTLFWLSLNMFRLIKLCVGHKILLTDLDEAGHFQSHPNSTFLGQCWFFLSATRLPVPHRTAVDYLCINHSDCHPIFLLYQCQTFSNIRCFSLFCWSSVTSLQAHQQEFHLHLSLTSQCLILSQFPHGSIRNVSSSWFAPQLISSFFFG